MKIKKLGKIRIIFENVEVVDIKPEAINSISLSPLQKHIFVSNGYIVNRNESENIALEFNEKLLDENYLILDSMFSNTDGTPEGAINQMFEHLYRHRDIVSIKIYPEEGDVIVVDVPWDENESMRNPHMNYEKKDGLHFVTFDSSVKYDLPPWTPAPEERIVYENDKTFTMKDVNEWASSIF